MSKKETIDANADLLPPEGTTLEPTVAEKFAPVRQYDRAAKLSFAQGAAFMVLAGVELLRLKKELGVKRGGNRKDQSQNVLTLNWREAVEQNCGFSYQTGLNYMAMAEAAKKRIPLLSTLPLLTTPLGELPELQQSQLLESTRKVTDGHTAQQLMWDWGIAKKPQGSAATGGDLNTDRASNRRTTAAETAWVMVGDPIAQLAHATDNPDAWTRCWYDLPLHDDQRTQTPGLHTLRSILADALQAADDAIAARKDEHTATVK